jgi:hypothetical protein
MKSLLSAILTALFIMNISGFTLAQSNEANQPAREESLQQKVNSLQIGKSNLDTIEKLMGKPEELRKAIELYDRSKIKERPMYYAEYPQKGLSFLLFADPYELYSITITTKDVHVHGLHIGDSVEQVRRKMKQPGEWRTTEAQDWWWLDFRGIGIKFGFERDRKHEKYPLRLAKPEVVTKIEIYNSSVIFN